MINKPINQTDEEICPRIETVMANKVSIFTRFSRSFLWQFRSCRTWRHVGGTAVADVSGSQYCFHLRESRGPQVDTLVHHTLSLMVITLSDTHVTVTIYIHIPPIHPVFGILRRPLDPRRLRHCILSKRREELN